MARIIIDTERCKGCGLCVMACPLDIVILSDKAINNKGYSPAVCIDMERCTGCASCALMCPDVCIEVQK